MQTDEQLAYTIRGCIFNVYNALGPGLLESVYQEALMIELTDAGLKAQKEVDVPIHYKGRLLGCRLRLDLLVEDRIIVELKAIAQLTSVNYKQTYSYLRLTGHQTAILTNMCAANIAAETKNLYNGPLPKAAGNPAPTLN